MLDDLPGMVRRLELMLVPGQSHGERVTSSSPHSTPAARLAAINLRVASTTLGADHPWWYQPPGDLADPEATGLPSIPGWVRQWSRAWRTRHDHHIALRAADPRGDGDEMPARPPRPPRPTEPLARGIDPRPWQEYAAALARWRDAMGTWHRQAEPVVVRGARITLNLGAAPALPDRPDDPLAEAWEARHGAPAEQFSLGRDAAYLRTWVESACDNPDLHPDIADFLGGLRMLHKSAVVVLEGRPVDQFCGRCPEVRYDRDTGEEGFCGANLWIDPYTSVLICGRCRSETRREDFLHLRARQLDAWSEDELREPVRRPAVVA